MGYPLKGSPTGEPYGTTPAPLTTLATLLQTQCEPAMVSRLAACVLVMKFDYLFSLGRNLFILVPHSGQVPFATRRPRSLVSTVASCIVRVVLHLTQ